MGILDKVMFWKKDDLKDFGDLGNNSFSSFQDPLNKPFAEGFTDPGNFIGTGDQRGRQAMNATLEQNTMSPFQSAYPQQPVFQQPVRPYQPQEHYPDVPVPSSNDFQVISAKLDAIKATLDALNQRMSNLESMTYNNEPRRRQW